MFDGLWKSVQRKTLTLSLRMLVRSHGSRSLSLSDCWLGISKCLICLPASGLEEQSLTLVLDRLRTRFPLSDLIVLTPPDFPGKIPDAVETLRLRREDFNFLGLPSLAVKGRLRSLNAQMAVDLSSRYCPLTAYCCELSGAKVKVGFALPEGERVFNYQVSPNAATKGMERYRVLATYIG